MTLDKDKIGIHNILLISENMLSAARIGDWDKLAGLEEQRRILLSAYFSHGQALEFGTDIAGLLIRINDINTEIMEAASIVMSSLEQELQLTGQKRKLAMTYSLPSP